MAKLARLDLSPAELARYQEDLSAIVGYMERLSSIDTSKAAPTLGVQPHANVFRKDVAGEPLGADGVLQNAPHRENNAFQIPRILEEA